MENLLFSIWFKSLRQIWPLTTSLVHIRVFALLYLIFNILITNMYLVLEVRGLRQSLQVEVLQDQTHLMLQEYCQTKCSPSQMTLTSVGPPPTSSTSNASKVRFGRLLLLLPLIHSVSAKSLELLFFKKTVGNIAVERVIADLFQST